MPLSFLVKILCYIWRPFIKTGIIINCLRWSLSDPVVVVAFSKEILILIPNSCPRDKFKIPTLPMIEPGAAVCEAVILSLHNSVRYN